MANVQAQFEVFHDTIKLKEYGENAILREKRDIIRDKLRERLPAVFEEHEEECPPFDFCDQGSYEMGTGTKPLDSDYDIDQGLYFEVATSAYPDPVVLKQRVFEALEGHTTDVRIRRPCVTVYYQLDGEPIYRVDIAVYSDRTANADGKDYLAKGKEGSEERHRIWEVSDPQGLTDTIFARFEGNDRAQFRRVVRYLKRWKDENFPADGNAAPRGIGLTVATYDDLQPTYLDTLAGKPDDLETLRKLVGRILGQFTTVWDETEQKLVRRLVVTLPVEPWGDLFARMTNTQMENLEAELEELRDALDTAAAAVDPVEACEALRKVFGSDFPVPPKQDTAKRHTPAIVSSSSSA
jgi:hypothetical protein